MFCVTYVMVNIQNVL